MQSDCLPPEAELDPPLEWISRFRASKKPLRRDSQDIEMVPKSVESSNLRTSLVEVEEPGR